MDNIGAYYRISRLGGNIHLMELMVYWVYLSTPLNTPKLYEKIRYCDE